MFFNNIIYNIKKVNHLTGESKFPFTSEIYSIPVFSGKHGFQIILRSLKYWK